VVAQGPKVAVIGAGMSGLTCARALAQRGVDVTVFDKGRGLGWRMATRRADCDFQFDHGVQYITARTEGFATLMKRAEVNGAVARWPNDSESLSFVGVPGMTGLARYLGAGLDIRKETRVDRIVKANGRWRVVWQGGEGVFDRVVVTTPAPQIAPLLPEDDIFTDALDSVVMDPCLTLMVGLSHGTQLSFGSRLSPDEDIAWITRDSVKPGRPAATCIVAQAGRGWSLQHLELGADAIADRMLPLVSQAIGADLAVDATYVSAHRWRYAFTSAALGEPFIADDTRTLFAGGDWCLGKKIEDAWSSGQAIADALLEDI